MGLEGHLEIQLDLYLRCRLAPGDLHATGAHLVIALPGIDRSHTLLRAAVTALERRIDLLPG
ncbi:hypothetical protein D3C77_820050 [compost metagenome]